MQHMAPPGPPFGWSAMVHDWTLRPGWLAAGVILLGGYAVALLVARRGGRSTVDPWRMACFVVGVVVLVGCVSSAIGADAMSAFYVHMILHLTLIMVVPVLLVLGHPLTVVRQGLPPRAGASFERALRSETIGVLTHPATGLVLYAAVIVGTHLTSFMDQMATRPSLMVGEQVLYVLAGWLLFLPLVGNEPIRWQVPFLARIGLLVMAMVPDTLVGIVLMQTPYDMFPTMMGMHPAWAPSPVHDLHIGGGLMWAAGDGLMMLVGVGVVIAMVSTGASRAQPLGPWLEGVRRSTLREHAAQASGRPAADPADDDADVVDVDSDHGALDAYNAMLSRLNERS